jgi:hypothetical protein
MIRWKKHILILLVGSLIPGFRTTVGQNSTTGLVVEKTVTSTPPASRPAEETGKDVLMNMTFDDLPEGNVQTRRREIRKRTGHRLHLYDKRADYDLTSNYPTQPWSKGKKGKALQISKLSTTRANTGYLFFEGYLKRYVIVEFDVYLPDTKAPFWLELTYHRRNNPGPRLWAIHKPALSDTFFFVPYKPKAKTRAQKRKARGYPAVLGKWTRYRIETDTEKRTASLWIGRPEGRMRLLKRNAGFDAIVPVFLNAIRIKLESGYSDQDVYIDNIKVYERSKRNKQ